MACHPPRRRQESNHRLNLQRNIGWRKTQYLKRPKRHAGRISSWLTAFCRSDTVAVDGMSRSLAIRALLTDDVNVPMLLAATATGGVIREVLE